MITKVFSLAKSMLPRISETEMIALKSGTVSVDRMIFEGKIDYKKLPTYKTYNNFDVDGDESFWDCKLNKTKTK